MIFGIYLEQEKLLWTSLGFLGTRGAVLHHSAEMVLLGYLGWVGLG